MFLNNKMEDKEISCELCKNPASNICYDCSFYLCDSCFDYLHIKKVNSEHKKEKIEPIIPINIKCTKHQKMPLSFYYIEENSK